MAPLINFSGIASGIDSAALIKATLDRERAAQIAPLQDKLTKLTDTNGALSELKSLLNKLKDAAYKFREISGTALAKRAASSDETKVSASSANSALNSTYELSVSSVAKNATFSVKSTAGRYTSSTDAISGGAPFSDTVTVEVGPPGDPIETVTVNVNETTTLSDFVTSFNSQSTKATASVINVGGSDPATADYRLVISSGKTGTAEGFLAVTIGASLQARNAFDNATLDNATDAAFTISGVSGVITRQTNAVSDVIPGLTFNLRSLGDATISVTDDPETTTAALQDYVDAYNKLVSYMRENDAVKEDGAGDNKKMVFGPLATTAVDENVLTAIRSAMSQASISGGSINTLADLGITTERDGTLKFDAEIFKTALGDDPELVRSITSRLGETLAATDGTIAQFTRFNGILDAAINSNAGEISRGQARVADLEKRLSQQEDTLTQRFSRLESLIGRLNSQQTALAQVLPR